jgi:photosystem II stability/assembly factor-like uncharacterized protein
MKYAFITLLSILSLLDVAAGDTTWTSFTEGLPQPFEKVYDLKSFDLCPPLASCWGFDELIIACTGGGVYGRYNSYDGAASDTLWRKLHDGAFHRATVNEISKTIYVADNMQLLKSSDRGENWDLVYLASESHLLNRGLAVTPVDTNLIFCSISWWTGTDGGVIKSTNGGGSWEPCDAAMECNRINCIAIHPHCPDTLFAGTDSGLYRSFDGGRSFGRVFESFEVHSVAVNPFRPNEIILGTAGASWSHGYYKSADNGTTWDVFHWMTGNLVVKYNDYVENQIFFSEADSSNSRTPPILVSNDGTNDLQSITQGAGFDCMNCFCISAIVNHDVLGGTVSHGVLRLDTDATSVARGSSAGLAPRVTEQACVSVFDPLGRVAARVPIDGNSPTLHSMAYGTYIFKAQSTTRTTLLIR